MPIDTNAPPKIANKPTPGINASPTVNKEYIPKYKAARQEYINHQLKKAYNK
jgi:hypothetical protein